MNVTFSILTKIFRHKKRYNCLLVSDYDLQTALMEALCRMATPEQRKELADRWFSMQHVASAFVKIRDSEFETVKHCNLSKYITFASHLH